MLEQKPIPPRETITTPREAYLETMVKDLQRELAYVRAMAPARAQTSAGVSPLYPAKTVELEGPHPPQMMFMIAQFESGPIEDTCSRYALARTRRYGKVDLSLYHTVPDGGDISIVANLWERGMRDLAQLYRSEK